MSDDMSVDMSVNLLDDMSVDMSVNMLDDMSVNMSNDISRVINNIITNWHQPLSWR